MLRPEPSNDSGREEQGQGAAASPRSSPSRRTPIVRNWTGGPLIPSMPTPVESENAPLRGNEARMNSPDSGAMNNNNGPSSAKQTRRRSRQSVSENYYGTSVEVARHTQLRQQQSRENEVDIKARSHTQQSRRIPPWIWWILAKSLGIKTHQTDRPLFGTFMHVLTLTSAFTFAITNTWYKIYDVKSEYTKETVLAGCVSIVIGLYWSSIGVYANLLAGRLFSNPRFKDSVRLHSKTIFKISAAGIMIVLSLTVVLMNIVGARHLFASATCDKVALNSLVCKFMYISRVSHSLFALVWNVMVGVVMLSVCRTHTIGIRRFIKELEEDGRQYELYQRRSGRDQLEILDPSDDLDDSILWQDLDEDEDQRVSEEEPEREVVSPVVEEDVIFRGPQPYMRSEAPPLDTPTRQIQGQGQPTVEVKAPIPISRQTHHSRSRNDFEAVELAAGGVTQRSGGQGHHGDEFKDIPPKIIIHDEDCREQEKLVVIEDDPPSESQSHQVVDLHSIASRASRSNAGSPNFSTRADYCNSPRQGMSEGTESIASQTSQPPILCNDDILLSYWKISCRLRNTSLALQRWLMAIIMLVILWSLTYIIYWVRHEATLLGIGEFVIPILLLPIICSAYGEVNYEGRRMLKCICPTTKRSGMLFYLTNNPLEMNVFGSPINYSTIGTVLTALGLAFASRLILDEMKM